MMRIPLRIGTLAILKAVELATTVNRVLPFYMKLPTKWVRLRLRIWALLSVRLHRLFSQLSILSKVLVKQAINTSWARAKKVTEAVKQQIREICVDAVTTI